MSSVGTGGPSAGWNGPCRPLRPVSLAVQVLVLVIAEWFLFGTYVGHDAGFHWSTHFLVGLIAAMVWHSAYLRLRGRPSGGQVSLVLVLHVYAMLPDLLFRGGVPHERWMDVFLAHVSSHYVPGGDTTWLVLGIVAVLAYALQLTRWLQATSVPPAAAMPVGP